jgi:hypothetical protein
VIIDWPRSDSEANMKIRISDNPAAGVPPNRPDGILDACKRKAAKPAGTAATCTALTQTSATRKSRRRRAPRDLSDGLPPYATVREFAAIAHVHPRTITRDIDDGLLIATEFRGARCISREDGRAYLRKIRSSVGHSQRRRSPRNAPNNATRSNKAEPP